MSQTHASLVVGEAQLLQFSLYLVHLGDSVDRLSLYVCAASSSWNIRDTYATPMIGFVCQCACNYKIDDGTQKKRELVTPLIILPNW
jgi:hypothetical protein